MPDYSVHSSLNTLFCPTLSLEVPDGRATLCRIRPLLRTPVASGETTEAASGNIGQRECIPHALLLGRETGSWIVLWPATPGCLVA